MFQIQLARRQQAVAWTRVSAAGSKDRLRRAEAAARAPLRLAGE